ncbi:hypothetical protein [Methanocella conradii]|uniref:hypothetical protein n=1 Tax=Methanocella conradii TaxID=1175444 RepID=UPI00064EAC16|nr:hypothetical protein [Methanocella conradii]MDI6896966.1 hypothetical protein [Methanocella conradii]
MFKPIYSSLQVGSTLSMPWYKAIISSAESTTRYLMDNYPGVVFRVVGQEEKNGVIFRVSEFLKDGKVIVHSTVEMPVDKNPPEFIDEIRAQKKPIGDILKQNGYVVERRITDHDTVFKEYVMVGDVFIKIKELYYDM